MRFDVTWAFIVIAIVICWSIGIGIYWERNRYGGSRHMRQQRNEARQRLQQQSRVHTSAHPAFRSPRPGSAGEATTGAAHTSVGPAAEHNLRVIDGGRP